MFINGFLIDETDRVKVEKADALGVWQGIPFTEDGAAAVTSDDPVELVNNRIGFDASGRLVFIDVATTTYSDKIVYVNGIAFTQDGSMIGDSSGDIATSLDGLPFTSSGFLAVTPTTPPIPPEQPEQKKLTPGVDMVTIELKPAKEQNKVFDHYSTAIVDKTYGYRLANRFSAIEAIDADLIRIYVPSKVGPKTGWMSTNENWMMDYVGISTKKTLSLVSPEYTNKIVCLPATTDTPMQPQIIAATGTLSTFTVTYAPGKGETSQIDGWFVGVGASLGDDSDYVYSFVNSGAKLTYAGKAFNADDHYGTCVRAYSKTGGMSNEGAFAEIKT